MEEIVLTAHLNDIRVALADLHERTGASQVSLLGASFGGGLVTHYTARGAGPTGSTGST
jgi:predicted alpha/beta-fold hydrolase